MSKTLALVAVLMLAIPLAFAQYGQPSWADKGTAKSSVENPPLKTIRGTISDDGKTFTSDKGNEIWTLKNPEEVKGPEGHRVNLNAHVYKDKHELHLMKVTMVGDEKK